MSNMNNLAELIGSFLKYYKRRIFFKVPSTDEKFEFHVSVVAVLKNEATYLEEWIVYHHLIGVQHFYLYDNESSDDVDSVLQPFINLGWVTLVKIPGPKAQMKSYSQAIQSYKGETEWMAWLDIDEFIQIGDGECLSEVLSKLPHDVSQLLLGWRVFGSSNLDTRTEGLVTERFIQRAEDSDIFDAKPIFKPKYVMENPKFPHWTYVSGKTIDEIGNRYYQYPFVTKRNAKPFSKTKIWINHYYSKSKEEFKKKRLRGFADHIQTEENMRNESDFKRHDKNDVRDESMVKYSGLIKQEMEKLHIK